MQQTQTKKGIIIKKSLPSERRYGSYHHGTPWPAEERAKDEGNLKQIEEGEWTMAAPRSAAEIIYSSSRETPYSKFKLLILFKISLRKRELWEPWRSFPLHTCVVDAKCGPQQPWTYPSQDWSCRKQSSPRNSDAMFWYSLPHFNGGHISHRLLLPRSNDGRDSKAGLSWIGLLW